MATLAEFGELVRKHWYPRWPGIKRDWTPEYVADFFRYSGARHVDAEMLKGHMTDMAASGDLGRFAPRPAQLADAMRPARHDAARRKQCPADSGPMASDADYREVHRAVQAMCERRNDAANLRGLDALESWALRVGTWGPEQVKGADAIRASILARTAGGKDVRGDAVVAAVPAREPGEDDGYDVNEDVDRNLPF